MHFLKKNSQKKESQKFLEPCPEHQDKYCPPLKPSALQRMMSLQRPKNRTPAMTMSQWRWMDQQQLRPTLPSKWTASQRRLRGRRPPEPPQSPAGCRRARRSWSLLSASSTRRWTTASCLACTSASMQRWVQHCTRARPEWSDMYAYSWKEKVCEPSGST